MEILSLTAFLVSGSRGFFMEDEMGKASVRRKKSRQAFLGRLALENPDRFLCEWFKRINSWCMVADKRAGRGIDSSGRAVPAAFEVIEIAMIELAECGERAFELAAKESLEILEDACCCAVAKAMDNRLYLLSSAQGIVDNGNYKVRR